MKPSQRDYYAFQEVWQHCVHRYLSAEDPSSRVGIVDDLRDSLVDIKEDGNKALRKQYDVWEENEFLPKVHKEFREWAKQNPFESKDFIQSQHAYDNILEELSYLKYHKILQIIQDSGIGLGVGGGSGFYIGPKDKGKFTE